jgi:hypothetical protein
MPVKLRRKDLATIRRGIAEPAPGAGAMFALRAIGIMLLARWLFAASQFDVLELIDGLTRSPWACINLIFMLLLVLLPGARARVEKPFHPLPRLLRQLLRILALLCCAFALWSLLDFAWSVGLTQWVETVATANGWPPIAVLLYLTVFWLCRPRALWRTQVAARRFAIGRYAIALDSTTGTVVVWEESRKVGQYAMHELSARIESHGRFGSRLNLLWNSPAAAGHNRRIVLRARLRGPRQRSTADALREALGVRT